MTAQANQIGVTFGRRGVDSHSTQRAKPAVRMMPYATPSMMMMPQPAGHPAPARLDDDRSASRSTKLMVSSQFASKPPLLKAMELLVLAVCTGCAAYMMLVQ